MNGILWPVRIQSFSSYIKIGALFSSFLLCSFFLFAFNKDYFLSTFGFRNYAGFREYEDDGAQY